MKTEKEFDLIDFITLLEKKKIPYLLIGRWAVILHGAPLMTADYDFWVSPKSKRKLLQLLDSEGYEVPPRNDWNHPILSVYLGPEKIDFFFIGKFMNRESQTIAFPDCLKRSIVKKDPVTGFRVRIPSLEDLIALKKMDRKNKESAIKDTADLIFLEQANRRKNRQMKKAR